MIKMTMTLVVLASLLSGCMAKRDDAELGIDATLRTAAESAESANDYRMAAGYYQSMVKRQPKNIPLIVRLAKMQRYSGDGQEALATLKTAMAKRKGPMPPLLLLELGKLQIALGRHSEAIETLKKLPTDETSNWEQYSALGVANDFLGDHKEAMEHHHAALALSPDNPIILNNMGLSLAETGDLVQATHLLEQANSRSGGNSIQVLQNLALMKALQGDGDAAAALVKKGLPSEVAIHNTAYFQRLAAATRLGKKVKSEGTSPPVPPGT